LDPTAPLLDIRELTAGYGAVTVLRDVSLQVPARGITALVGSNGAGKTTLLRTVAGLLAPRAGTIDYDGAPAGAWTSSRRVASGIVLVPEGRLIFPHFTVEENLRIAAYAPAARARFHDTAAQVYALFPRLKERRSQLGGLLSGGEQQMLAIGRGLMALPRLLLLDEPTLGLAPVMAQQIFALVPQLRAMGMSILLAEQDVRTTLAIADWAYVLENGSAVINGPARTLLDDPRLRASYLGL
jgi:branched-chain amino acid transport system ATP-binding protein